MKKKIIAITTAMLILSSNTALAATCSGNNPQCYSNQNCSNVTTPVYSSTKWYNDYVTQSINNGTIKAPVYTNDCTKNECTSINDKCVTDNCDIHNNDCTTNNNTINNTCADESNNCKTNNNSNSNCTNETPATPQQDTNKPQQNNNNDSNNQNSSNNNSQNNQDSKVPVTESEYAAEVVRLVNEERAKHGLNPLKTDSVVQTGAQIRAQEIVSTFSHDRPNGSSCFTALQQVGASYSSAGENIAYGQKTPAEVVNAWMNSPGHRANILNSGYTTIGIGVYKTGNTYYWSQFFTS